MTYFKISTEYKPEVIGVQDALQSLKMHDGYDYNSPNSVRNISGKYKELPFVPKLDTIQLERKAILTDLISCGVITSGLICSPRLLKLFQKFKISRHQIFDATLTNDYSSKSSKEKYHFLFLNTNVDELLDITKSTFITKPIIYDPMVKEEEIRFKTYDELSRAMIPTNGFFKGKKWIKLKKLVFKESMNLDLFRLPYIGDTYVSERLKKAITVEKLSGMAFEKAEYLILQNEL